MPKTSRLSEDQEFAAVCDAWFETHATEPAPPSFSAALHRLDRKLDEALILADESLELSGWFKA